MPPGGSAAGAEFGPAEAGEWIAVPREADDKYSRGVVGFVTGSERYPGAAVLGVEAALRTGVGMVRYLGPERPTGLVLARRPEAVTVGGRVQAWVLGSGIEAEGRDAPTVARLDAALAEPVPRVLDAGALEFAGAGGPLVLTPHAGELATLLGAERDDVLADPAGAAAEAATRYAATVLLKGHVTRVASPDGELIAVRSAPTWLATAGAGDALAGVLGALLATHSARIAADRAVLAPLAATRASGGGPLTVLELCAALPGVIADLLSGR